MQHTEGTIMNNEFNLERRRALKIFTGVTATGFIANGFVKTTPAIAAPTVIEPAVKELIQNKHFPEAILDCKLISRADVLRAHLLMHNKTQSDIVVNTIESRTISYDNTFLNLAKAYTGAYAKPMTIPANDRVMVRLNMESTLEPVIIDNNVMTMETQFLPFGSRVVDMKLIVRDGVAEVTRYSVMT